MFNENSATEEERKLILQLKIETEKRQAEAERNKNLEEKNRNLELQNTNLLLAIQLKQTTNGRNITFEI